MRLGALSRCHRSQSRDRAGMAPGRPVPLRSDWARCRSSRRRQAARRDHDAGSTTLKLIGLAVLAVSIDAMVPFTRQCAGTPFALSTHDGADSVILRTGSPIADAATDVPSRSAVQSAAVNDVPWLLDATLNSPSAGGVTRRSVGFVSCGIHAYGIR